jgi:hypothetical protein
MNTETDYKIEKVTKISWFKIACWVLLIGLVVFLIYCALKGTGDKSRRSREQIIDNRVYQIHVNDAPELQELIKEFEKSHKPDLSIDFRNLFDDDEQAHYLQTSCMKFPKKKKLFDTYEHDKRNPENYKGPWYRSLGKLIHKLFRSHDYRAKWSQKLADQTGDIRISGNFYYPPGGFREWHTNRKDTPGWRLYYVRTAEPDKSWFNYVDPVSKKMHQIADRDQHFNLFNLDDSDGLLWHSIYSDTHRFSLGLHVTDEYAKKLINRSKNSKKTLGRSKATKN